MTKTQKVLTIICRVLSILSLIGTVITVILSYNNYNATLRDVGIYLLLISDIAILVTLFLKNYIPRVITSAIGLITCFLINLNAYYIIYHSYYYVGDSVRIQLIINVILLILSIICLVSEKKHQRTIYESEHPKPAGVSMAPTLSTAMVYSPEIQGYSSIGEMLYKLERLSGIRDKGIITQEDYNKKKNEWFEKLT